MQRVRQRNVFTAFLYARAILFQFRWTIAVLAAAVLLGGIVYSLTPAQAFKEGKPSFWAGLFYSWMAMLSQPAQADTWYLQLLCGLYPLIGFVVVGEGIVRLAMLIASREHGKKEWMTVMASTYRDHVVLCGVGHLGYRVLEQLLASQVPVVVLEKDPEARFMSQVKAAGVPVLIRNMTEDQSLVDAGVPNARVIIIATNEDMANLEVALDARKMNPKIRIIMRLFDQQIARKISDALTIDAAFSSSALAAPIVAAMSLDTKVMASYVIGETPYVTAEVRVDSSSVLCGRNIAEIEKSYSSRIIARTLKSGTLQSPPPLDATIVSGDTLVVHTAASKLTALTADSKLMV
ncbi:MAG TPA: NAD-binding protein [Planctomycetota bacterium]|nr:NAD-binding protein [Planctomycetota bacterium]